MHDKENLFKFFLFFPKLCIFVIPLGVHFYNEKYINHLHVNYIDKFRFVFMKLLARRTFLKKSSHAGIVSLLGAWSYPKFIHGMAGNNYKLLQKAKTPICTVKKEVRVAMPQLMLAPRNSMSYIGRGMRRQEGLSFMQSSDWSIMNLRRTSEDNGHTWSPWVHVPIETQTEGQFTKSGGPSQGGTGPYDPASGKLIKRVFQRLFQGRPQEALKTASNVEKLFWDHGFYQLSDDDGRTWGDAYQLKYEDGPDFDPYNWGNPEWLRSNEMYIGSNIIVLKNGSVVISATVPVPYRDEEDEKYPAIFPNTYREGCVAGAMCFIGRWNKAEMNYKWKKSNQIFLPRRISSRGLVELDLSELKNGNILLIMRGSNAGLDITKSPGRRWFSVSRDGGFTWDNVKDMRYDTGERFYSPATISRTIRSSKTGRLYWVGNITNVPANGNHPRYPLQIVEIDENGPSFRKDTVTVIDDRDPEHDTERVQLSNFSLLEDRETQEMEVYLTRLGENVNTWSANAYKYTLEF